MQRPMKHAVGTPGGCALVVLGAGCAVARSRVLGGAERRPTAGVCEDCTTNAGAVQSVCVCASVCWWVCGRRRGLSPNRAWASAQPPPRRVCGELSAVCVVLGWPPGCAAVACCTHCMCDCGGVCLWGVCGSGVQDCLKPTCCCCVCVLTPNHHCLNTVVVSCARCLPPPACCPVDRLLQAVGGLHALFLLPITCYYLCVVCFPACTMPVTPYY